MELRIRAVHEFACRSDRIPRTLFLRLNKTLYFVLICFAINRSNLCLAKCWHRPPAFLKPRWLPVSKQTLGMSKLHTRLEYLDLKFVSLGLLKDLSTLGPNKFYSIKGSFFSAFAPSSFSFSTCLIKLPLPSDKRFITSW